MIKVLQRDCCVLHRKKRFKFYFETITHFCTEEYVYYCILCIILIFYEILSDLVAERKMTCVKMNTGT